MRARRWPLGLLEMCGVREGSPAKISGKEDSNPTANHLSTANQVSRPDKPGEEVNNISGDTVNPTESNLSETAKAVLDKFPEGVGRIKDVELRLDIDESVTPAVQYTKAPFQLRLRQKRQKVSKNVKKRSKASKTCPKYVKKCLKSVQKASRKRLKVSKKRPKASKNRPTASKSVQKVAKSSKKQI